MSSAPFIFRTLLHQTLYSEALRRASNSGVDALAHNLKSLPSKGMQGLLMVEYASSLSSIAMNGICRIVGDKCPIEYDATSELARLAAIIINMRSLSDAGWSKIFEWSASDYKARYRVESDICKRLIAASKGPEPIR